MKKILGLTLIELLLGLTLSVFLMVGVYSVYLVSIKSMHKQMSLIHLQENMRALSASIMRDIQEGSLTEKKVFYFVQATGRRAMNGAEIYALYKKDVNHNKVELVEGVEEIKIKYDVLEDEFVIEKEADEVGDLKKIIGVSVSVVLCEEGLKKRGFIYAAVRNRHDHNVDHSAGAHYAGVVSTEFE